MLQVFCLWQIAARHRLTVNSVKSEKAIPAAGYMEQPLTVTMEGRFDGFYQFLMQLENLPRITRIHEMKLERDTGRNRREEAPPGMMKAEFKLSIYFQSQSEASDQ